jgi:hypothetical protein
MPESLQDIIKRYNFAGVATTQWQDPRASTLPYRGGGAYTVSPQAMSKAYTPTYRYPINPPKPPDPTDDEASDSDNEDDGNDGKYWPLDPNICVLNARQKNWSLLNPRR